MATTPTQTRNDPMIIYDHLARMCEYRGAKVTERLNVTAPDKFLAKMEASHYVQIKAERSSASVGGTQSELPPAHIIVIQFSAYRHIDSSSPRFRAFLEGHIIKNRPADGVEFNVILVTSGPISAAIGRIIAEQRAPGIVVEHYQASTFIIVVPEHVSVPHHTIVPQAEVDRLCREMHMPVSGLPCIVGCGQANADPVAVWLGIRPGMVARIDRPSETAGIETVYRRCI
jgi:DNA-directed RNA polymerase subunit H (RpoH/RPB5)